MILLSVLERVQIGAKIVVREPVVPRVRPWVPSLFFFLFGGWSLAGTSNDSTSNDLNQCPVFPWIDQARRRSVAVLCWRSRVLPRRVVCVCFVFVFVLVLF